MYYTVPTPETDTKTDTDIFFPIQNTTMTSSIRCNLLLLYIANPTAFRCRVCYAFTRESVSTNDLDTPKNGRNRTIDVDPQIIALLRELRLEQSKKAISQYVFTQEGRAEPIHPQSPARYLQNFARKYGVQGLHPHKLRHSFASIAITNGADIASVSEKLGHTDKAVTLRMYTHADQESIKRASQIFRDAIKQA